MTAIRPMIEAPRDGRRILLKYVVMYYGYPPEAYLKSLPSHQRRLVRGFQGWYPDGDKWEECFYETPELGNWGLGRDAWTPWCGNAHTRSTETIREERCLGWMPVPELYAVPEEKPAALRE